MNLAARAREAIAAGSWPAPPLVVLNDRPMAKRVGVILSGCGRFDGTDVAEAMLVLLVLERAGAEAICAAPDVALPAVVDHAQPEGRAG